MGERGAAAGLLAAGPAQRRVEVIGAVHEDGAGLDAALCWTGCKETGRGAALSSLGYLSLTRPKSYHLRKL